MHIESKTTVTLSRADLLKAAGFVGRVVERRNTIPILSNALLTVSDGKLALKATDLDIEATAHAPCEGGPAGAAITVPAGTLNDILRKLPDGAQVTMEWGETDGQMTLRSGRSRFRLQTLPESDFPDLSAGDFAASFDLPGPQLARILALVDFAISTEETRYYLNGVYMHPCALEDGPGLRFVATDGHRLSRVQIIAPEGAEGREGFAGVIIPRKAVAEIAGLAKAAKDAPVRIEVNATKIRVGAAGLTLTSKLIDGTFPDYARVIPTSNEKRAVVDREALIATVDRVATISAERGRAVKFAFEADALRLEVNSPDNGQAADEMEIAYDAAPVAIGFNARYVADILSALPGDRTAILLGDPGSPTIIEPVDAAHGVLTVLMPMRV